MAKKIKLNDQIGCLGEFNNNDIICKKMCALRVSCMIETERIRCQEIQQDIEEMIETQFLSLSI